MKKELKVSFDKAGKALGDLRRSSVVSLGEKLEPNSPPYAGTMTTFGLHIFCRLWKIEERWI